MEDSGAAAWIPAGTNTEFQRITFKAPSHLVVAGTTIITTVTGQLPSYLHIHSQGSLTLNETLNIPTYVDGIFDLPGKSVTISQSLRVWGTVSSHLDAGIVFNGDLLQLFPDETLPVNQILSLMALDIGTNAAVVLDKSDQSTHCGYTLDIHGGQEGSITMGAGSSLTVACPVTIDADSVNLHDAIFDQVGHESNSFTEPSLIRTPNLVISGDVSTGLVKLEGVDDFSVSASGDLTFEPFHNNFTVATVTSAGIVQSTLPLSVVSELFEITGGQFTWSGSAGSSFDAHTARIDGVFKPGAVVSSSDGFHEFVVGSQGNVVMNMLTDFQTDQFYMSGTMAVNQDVVFTGSSSERINTFTTGENSQLILVETESDAPCQIHADNVTIDGHFKAGPLDIGVGFISLRVGGHLVFEPVEDLQIHEVVVSGWFESQSHMSLGYKNDTDQTIFQTTPGSTVILNSNSSHNLNGLTHSQLSLISLEVGGTFTGSDLEFTFPMNSVLVTESGNLQFTSVG